MIVAKMLDPKEASILRDADERKTIQLKKKRVFTPKPKTFRHKDPVNLDNVTGTVWYPMSLRTIIKQF